MKKAGAKADREAKKREITAQLDFLKGEERHFKTLYTGVITQLNQAKSTEEINKIGGMISFITEKYDFMVRLRAGFNDYFQIDGVNVPIRDDAVQRIYDHFIDEVIKSAHSVELRLLQSKSSLLSIKYQLIVNHMPKSCAVAYWNALVNHIISLQSEDKLSILSQFIAQSIENYTIYKNLKKRISSLKKELAELGFDPDKEPTLSIISGEIKNNFKDGVIFTQEMDDFCTERQESLDFVSTKIAAIKTHIVNECDVVKEKAAVPSRTSKHRIQENEYDNPYKISAHHLVTQAKTQEDLDIAIKFFCLAEHKQGLQVTSHVVCPPPSDAHLYLSRQIRQACTIEEMQSIHRMLAILQCVKDNYPNFFNAIIEIISESDSKKKALIALHSFKTLSSPRTDTDSCLMNFFMDVVDFYREENPEKVDALLNEYYNPYKTSAHHFVIQAKAQGERWMRIKCSDHKERLQETSHVVCPSPSHANSYLSHQIHQARTIRELRSMYCMLAILQCVKKNYPNFFNAIIKIISDLNSKEKASIARCSFKKLSNSRIDINSCLMNFFKTVIVFCEEENPGTVGVLLKEIGQGGISKHIKETLAQDAQNLKLNQEVNACLKSHFDSMRKNTMEWGLSWLFKYGYSETDTLAAIERLYARKALNKEHIYQLSCYPLCQKLLSTTKIKSIQDLLEKLDYIDAIDEKGAKHYRRLSINFEPCPLIKNAVEVPPVHSDVTRNFALI